MRFNKFSYLKKEFFLGLGTCAYLGSCSAADSGNQCKDNGPECAKCIGGRFRDEATM